MWLYLVIDSRIEKAIYSSLNFDRAWDWGRAQYRTAFHMDILTSPLLSSPQRKPRT